MQNDSYSVHVHRMFLSFLGIPVLIFAGFIVCALLAIPLTPILWVIDKFRNRNPTPVPETPKNPFKLDEITWALSPRQLRDRHELYVRWAHRIYLNISIRPDTLKNPRWTMPTLKLSVLTFCEPTRP